MRAQFGQAILAAALLAATGAAQAADLTVRVDAREIARKRVHTDLTLAVKRRATDPGVPQVDTG